MRSVVWRLEREAKDELMMMSDDKCKACLACLKAWREKGLGG